MHRKTAAEPIATDDLPNMISVMVTLRRPSSTKLMSYNRRQKYSLLKQSATKARVALIDWMAARGLSEEVARVGRPTALNVLFVICTPRAARLMARAPGVAGVAPTGPFKVELAP